MHQLLQLLTKQHAEDLFQSVVFKFLSLLLSAGGRAGWQNANVRCPRPSMQIMRHRLSEPSGATKMKRKGHVHGHSDSHSDHDSDPWFRRRCTTRLPLLYSVYCVYLSCHTGVLYSVHCSVQMLESKVLHLLPFQTVHSQTEHSLLIQILFSRLCTTELFIGDYVLQNWAFLSTLCTSERLKSLLWIFIKTLYLRTFSSSLCTPKAMYSRTSLLSRF